MTTKVPTDLMDVASTAEITAGIEEKKVVVPKAAKEAIDAAVAAAVDTAIANSVSITVGEVSAFAVGAVPSKYLECNGATIARLDYPDLWDVIGDLYGAGDGSTTFEIPDLRGEFIRGWASDGVVDTGRILGSWQADLLISHSHGIKGSNSTGSPNVNSVIDSGSGSTNASTNSAGGDETRPRNIAMMYIIRYEG